VRVLRSSVRPVSLRGSRLLGHLNAIAGAGRVAGAGAGGRGAGRAAAAGGARPHRALPQGSVKDEGIRSLGGNRFAVRVARVDARTGHLRNRKVTVSGTRAQARAARDRFRDELSSSCGQRPRTRLADFGRDWVDRREKNLEIQAPSARRYRFALRHIAAAAIGELFVDAITRADVAAYVAGRVAAVGQKGGESVRTELRLLRALAADSVAEGFALKPWADRIAAPPVRGYDDDRPNLFTPDAARRVLEDVAQHERQWLPVVALMITTGLRWGEATGLGWEHIDVAALVAKIRRGNRRGELAGLKTRSSYRTVPLLPEVLALFGLQRTAGLLFQSRRRDGEIGAFRGNPLVRVFRRVCARLGVAYVTPHGLRRTWNNIGRGAADREVLKAISGHATDAMVDHYSHVDAGEKRQLARAVADKMGIAAALAAGGVLQPPVSRPARRPPPDPPRRPDPPPDPPPDQAAKTCLRHVPEPRRRSANMTDSSTETAATGSDIAGLTLHDELRPLCDLESTHDAGE
jgi:integrase